MERVAVPGYMMIEYVKLVSREKDEKVNTKLIALLVSAIAVGTIAFFSAGSPSTQQTSTSSCNTESASLLAGSFTQSQSIPNTYTVSVRNSQTQTVRLASYSLGTRSYSIDVAIAAGQNGT